MEEYQEAEVIWAEHSKGDAVASAAAGKAEENLPVGRRPGEASKPIRIPDVLRTWAVVWRDGVTEEEAEMVPPHVMVERRIAGEIAFSVCTGNGRTLKGRDLSQVRNSVLRMTGFLET